MSRSFNEDLVLAKVKKTLLSRGGTTALKDTVRIFRAMDVNDDNELSPKEFNEGLKKLGVLLSPAETKHLLISFDKNRDGRISMDEFITHLIGGLNPRRTQLVQRAFKKFDKSGDGKISLVDLQGTFKADNNPLVLRGEKTVEDIMGDFLKTFDDAANPDGIVTKEEFSAYYAGVSAGIPHDDYFEAMILKAWDLDESDKPRLDSTHREWGANGDPLEITDPLVASSVKNMGLSLPAKAYNYAHMRRAPAPEKKFPSLKPDYITTSRRDYPSYSGGQIRAADPTTDRPVNRASEAAFVFSPSGNAVVDRVRQRIIARKDNEGFLGLRRTFSIMDKDKNYTLTKEEIKMAMQRYRIELSPLELDTVWTHVDTSKDGKVSVTEFLRMIRGPLVNPKRIEFIRLAFDVLDTNKNGAITSQEVASKYDASQHPLVLQGKKTQEEVIAEFSERWDKDCNAIITWEEWLEYYSDISAGIDDDSYFELMIRNAWHISGGTGSSANTSCRRVLAKFEDGTQRVLEIKNDLGLRADDINGMKQRLLEQGHTDIKEIKLYG